MNRDMHVCVCAWVHIHVCILEGISKGDILKVKFLRNRVPTLKILVWKQGNLPFKMIILLVFVKVYKGLHHH